MNKVKGPRRNHREGITVIQLAQKFPDEETDRVWIERILWPIGRVCPRCKETDTHESTHKTLPIVAVHARASSVFARNAYGKQ